MAFLRAQERTKERSVCSAWPPFVPAAGVTLLSNGERPASDSDRRAAPRDTLLSRRGGRILPRDILPNRGHIQARCWLPISSENWPFLKRLRGAESLPKCMTDREVGGFARSCEGREGDERKERHVDFIRGSSTTRPRPLRMENESPSLSAGKLPSN